METPSDKPNGGIVAVPDENKPEKKRGRGRPKGTKRKQKRTLEREEWQRHIAAETMRLVKENWTPMLQAAIDLAVGVKRVVKTPRGEIRVYETLPDTKAISALMNRALGMPQALVDVTSNGKEVDSVAAIQFTVVNNKQEIHVERKENQRIIDTEASRSDGVFEGQDDH